MQRVACVAFLLALVAPSFAIYQQRIVYDSLTCQGAITNVNSTQLTGGCTPIPCNNGFKVECTEVLTNPEGVYLIRDKQAVASDCSGSVVSSNAILADGTCLYVDGVTWTRVTCDDDSALVELFDDAACTESAHEFPVLPGCVDGVRSYCTKESSASIYMNIFSYDHLDTNCQGTVEVFTSDLVSSDLCVPSTCQPGIDTENYEIVTCTPYFDYPAGNFLVQETTDEAECAGEVTSTSALNSDGVCLTVGEDSYHRVHCDETSVKADFSFCKDSECNDCTTIPLSLSCSSSSVNSYCLTAAAPTSQPTTSPTVSPSSTPKPEPEGLSGGAVAGIVIGVLLGVAAIGGLFYYMGRRQNYQAV